MPLDLVVRSLIAKPKMNKIEILFFLSGHKKEKMTQIETENGEWLEQCDNCGNIWDGNAQCNCWQMNWQEEEAEAEAADDSGYDDE